MDDFGMGYALGQDSGSNHCCNNNGGGFGGMWGEGIWAVIILGMIFGWGRGGFGGFGGGGWGEGFGGWPMMWGINSAAGQGALTRADLCSEFNFNNLDNAVRGVQQGLCDGFYAMNTSLLNGFNGVDNAVCQLGYQTQQGFSTLGAQMAQCCCDTQRAIDNVNFQTLQGLNGITNQISSCCCDTQRQLERGFADLGYNLATQECQTRQTIQDTTRDILDNQNSNARAILDFLTQDKIASLQAENQSLKFQASQSAQNAFITANQEAQTAEIIRRLGRDCPVPAYVVPNPNCCYGAYGYNGNSCNCGTCC